MRRVPPIVWSAGLLAAGAAALGLEVGRRWATLSETEVIAAWAAEYVAETGGAPTDCAATPGGRDGVWLIVRCGSGETGRVYPLDRRGRLVPDDDGPSA